MKKLQLSAFIILSFVFYLPTFAQSFEIKTGINLATMLSKDIYETYSKDYRSVTGLVLGATADFPITELYSFEIGLLFSSKGYEYDVPNFATTKSGEVYNLYQKAALNYIDIPISGKLSKELGKMRFIGTFGPYLGVGLTGEIDVNEYSGDGFEIVHHNKEMGSHGIWKRLDYGFQAGTGIELNRFVLRCNYAYGMANLSINSKYKIKNRVLGLTLGYKFEDRKSN